MLEDLQLGLKNLNLSSKSNLLILRPQTQYEETKARRAQFEKNESSEEGEHNYEVEEHEETKSTYVDITSKKLLFTPSEKKQPTSYGYEPGEHTHEKVNMLIDKESDKGEV